jgi:hypothetical protein
MARIVVFGLLFVALVGGAVYAQDPGLPDSIIFGNLDRSIFLASLDADIVIPVWTKTDDSVSFIHIPLGTHNQYISSRNGGTIYYPVNAWDDFSVLAPNVNYPIQGVTNQSILGFCDLGGQPNPTLHTNYTWIKIAEFRIHTTPDIGVLGDTTELFPGANAQNGTLVYSDPSGSLNWEPVAFYSKLFFPPNNPPVFTSPAQGTFEINRGFEVSCIVDCTDEDNDPMVLTVDFADPNYTFQQLINVPGHIRYQFNWVAPASGDSSYNLVFTANDGQGGVVNRSLVFNMTTTGLSIGTVSTIPGSTFTIPVSLNNTGITSKIGACEILIAWDSQAMTLANVARTGRLGSWEYFNTRMNDAGPGTVRIVGLADMVNGVVSPPLAPGTGPIFNLNFVLANDEELIGVRFPIAFLTQDVTDNTLSDSTGYILVHPSLSDGAINVIGPNQVLIGDINLNGIAYESGDLVLFINHLITPTLYPFTSVQVQSTDINSDGIPLTVADLVYLLNIVNGNMPPPSKPEYNEAFAQFVIPELNGNTVNVNLSSNVPTAGLFAKLNHHGITLAEPRNNTGLQMAYHDDGEILTVLMYDPNGQGLPEGEHGLFSVTATSNNFGIGSLTFAETQASDPYGRLVSSGSLLPDEYALYESYPNPFNASTKIGFAITNPGFVMLDIFDVAGRQVRSLANSQFPAGKNEIIWDGRDNYGNSVASGVYFYRLKVNEFNEVKKTTLLK